MFCVCMALEEMIVVLIYAAPKSASGASSFSVAGRLRLNSSLHCVVAPCNRDKVSREGRHVVENTSNLNRSIMQAEKNNTSLSWARHARFKTPLFLTLSSANPCHKGMLPSFWLDLGSKETRRHIAAKSTDLLYPSKLSHAERGSGDELDMPGEAMHNVFFSPSAGHFPKKPQRWLQCRYT